MQINGETTYSNVYLDKTLYTSPYLVMTEHEYTKHYFIEGERVCSKLGGGFGPAEMPPTSEPLEFIAGDEDEIAIRLHHLVHRNIDCTGYSGEWEIHSGLEPAHHDTNDPEYRQYFYHPDHLGSSSFITEKHGEAEQHLQYLPFGELFTSQRNHNYDSRYKFSAKELDSESGYNYFGARYYDSELSNWLSVDPLADERSWVSPYSYVQNSPVMRVDPSGALDVEDNYTLDKEGNVEHQEDTDDNFDMLYTKSDWEAGNMSNGEKINDQGILADLEAGNKKDGLSIARDYGEGSIDDMYKVFLFAADNSDVEWAIARYNNDKYAVWTKHDPDAVTSSEAVGLSNINARVHSHPGISGNYRNELYSMGANWSKNNQYYYCMENDNYGKIPDWRRMVSGKLSKHEYVYFPNTGNLYGVFPSTKNKPALIRNVSGQKSFYFGTLNHR